jgi:spore maturation protein CgeB
MADNGHCPSGRLFEAAACGTPVLSDWWPGLDAFFEPGREILVARQAQDVVAALELSDAQLARIAQAARERVLSDHTSERRAAELERMLEEAAAREGRSDDDLGNHSRGRHGHAHPAPGLFQGTAAGGQQHGG